MCYISVFVSVPESKGLPLAETAQDIVRMAREFRYFTWRTWRRERTVTPSSDGE